MAERAATGADSTHMQPVMSVRSHIVCGIFSHDVHDAMRALQQIYR